VASRAEQKAAAKAERIALEQAHAAAARRARLVRLGGVIVAAVVVVVVLIVISSGSSSGPKTSTKASSATAAGITALLSGIPQSGTTLGSPTAPVTVTEYGDLECPDCAALFALGTGAEVSLISTDVRSGRVKLVYKSLETATGNSDNSFPTQQAAAYAAGAQDRAFNFIELFYNEQGPETTDYVTESYLDGLAKQIPGLNLTSWIAARKNPKYAAAVAADEQEAANQGFDSTPTLVISGPKGTAQPIEGVEPYSAVEQTIQSVS